MAAHPRPHAPQWNALVFVSVSQPLLITPSQSPNPALHGPTLQTPALQRGMAFGELHAWPHMPQLVALPVVSTSQPFAAAPSQSAVPVGHMPAAQTPALQTAPGPMHACPQPPHALPLVDVSASQPFAASPSQSANPVSQVDTQRPAEHVVVWCGPAAQEAQPASPPSGEAAEPHADSDSAKALAMDNHAAAIEER